MLVLSRKKNESIVIDGQIRIEVLKVKGNTIRLGISAPADVKILRGELAPFGKQSKITIDASAIVDVGDEKQLGSSPLLAVHAS